MGEDNSLAWPAKIDNGGHIYVPKKVRQILKERGDLGKYYQVSIEKRE